MIRRSVESAPIPMKTNGLVFVSTALLMLACARDPGPRIALEEGAHTPSPTFVIDGPEAPRFITVERTSGQPGRAGEPTFWRLVRRNDTTVTPPLRVVYGVVPAGYQAATPAALLFPARYRIYAKLTHAAGWRLFTVQADGRVR